MVMACPVVAEEAEDDVQWGLPQSSFNGYGQDGLRVTEGGGGAGPASHSGVDVPAYRAPHRAY